MNDEVGYKKPPKATQFKKGSSGNPKGRPKGSKNLSTIISQDARQLVRVNGPNGTRTMTKQQAIVLQLGNKAAQGDLAASRAYLNFIQLAEAQHQVVDSSWVPNELDTVAMEHMYARIRSRDEKAASSIQAIGGEE